jgi:hypothetical protein
MKRAVKVVDRRSDDKCRAGAWWMEKIVRIERVRV